MRIGELADEVGVNPKTIRYYESIGLLPEPDRTTSGYRDYTPADVERLAFIRRAQRLDLRLDEIGEILALREQGERPCDYVLDAASRHIEELDRRIREMQRARAELSGLLDRADELPEDQACYCNLIEHHTPQPTTET